MTVRERLTALGLSPRHFAEEFSINAWELEAVLDFEDFPCITDGIVFLEKFSETLVKTYVYDVALFETNPRFRGHNFVVFEHNDQFWKYFPQFCGLPSCVHRTIVSRASIILKERGILTRTIVFSLEEYSRWLISNTEEDDNWLTLMAWASEQRTRR